MVSELSSTMDNEQRTNNENEQRANAGASSCSESKLYLQAAQATTIKLTESNFLVWQIQIIATINGYGLEEYLSNDSPPMYLTEADRQAKKVNKKREHWRKQDQLLASWLVASMTEEMVTRIQRQATSRQIWDRLHVFFSSQTRAKERLLRLQLRNTKKGTKSMSEYLLSVKKAVDELNSVGASISTHEHVESIFDGLPKDYESFVTNVSLRGDEYTVTEIEALLLIQETRVEKFKENLESVSANLTQTQQQNRTQNQNFRPQNPQFNNYNPRNYNANRGGGFRGNFNNSNRGRSRGRMPNAPYDPWTPSNNTWNGQRSHCQVCGRTGHLAVNCYHRYDQSYTEATLQQALNSQQPRPSYVNANNPPMEAMIAAPETLFDANWYPDSGASNHVTNTATNLHNRQPYDGSEKVFVGNGQGLQIPNIGHSSILLNNNTVLELKNLLHVPAITKNLISVSKLARDNNVYLEFNADAVLIKSQETKETLLKGRIKDGLYCFDNLQLQHLTKHAPYTTYTVQTSDNKDFSLWHSRLGHCSAKIVHCVLNKCNIKTFGNHSDVCHACCLGKSHALPFSSSLTQYTKPLELVHSDVWGPAPILSSTGYKYYVSFIDAYSRYTWLYLLKNKSDVLEAFIQFKTFVENQLNHKIKALQSDFGGEFQALTKTLQASGIHHRISCPHTHQQNGVAERKHRHITETGLALLAHASMPLKYWDEAFRTSVYIINRLPTTTLKNPSPLEVLFGTSVAEIKTLIHQLHQNFALKDLGKLHYFLGIEVNYQPNDSILLTQNKYLRDLLQKAGMSATKPVNTPMIPEVIVISSINFFDLYTQTITLDVMEDFQMKKGLDNNIIINNVGATNCTLHNIGHVAAASRHRDSNPENSPGVGHRKFGEDDVKHYNYNYVTSSQRSKTDFKPTEPGHSPGVGHAAHQDNQN
ncbi:Retrovirus-related Pol polyprotein from transposon TNT 1-94 [Senna tora]|uniref:Retrovirus-related Pol polyprotein from transposon TNT 1-94 n=1 Tax=Senna tora TaxID=362788 RepID=A0A834STR1_9FABA|nr:Retrovirus-related Pol polyprotein from transposon TNT 1-94 [Senna tora]